MDEDHLTQQVTRESHTGGYRETKEGFLEVQMPQRSPAVRGGSGPDRGQP